MRSHFDRAVPQNSAECGISHRGNSVHGAGAPLPPSSEGGKAATAARHRFTSVRPTIKMCAHGAHTFVFHAPEGRASYTAGVLHVPKARFVCGAKHRLRRTVPRETVF